MKKIQLNTAKLQLNKEKVMALSEKEMSRIAGGHGPILPPPPPPAPTTIPYVTCGREQSGAIFCTNVG